jgi:hypothetical protein
MAQPPVGSIRERASALWGFDPEETLEKMRLAQKKLEELRDEESTLAGQLAMYEARYGYPSHFEHERKANLCTLMEGERNRQLARGEKPTEKQLDNFAHAHANYLAFLDAAKRERLEWNRLKAKLVEVQNEIEVAKGAVTYYERKARLNESMIFHSGKEMGL